MFYGQDVCFHCIPTTTTSPQISPEICHGTLNVFERPDGKTAQTVEPVVQSRSMDEEYPFSPVEEPADESDGPSVEKTSPEVESTEQILQLEESPVLDYVDEIKDETKDDPQAFEPPLDWLEPLEDDDDDDEEGSLGGESEISVNVGTTGKKRKKGPLFHLPRGKRSHPDEGWEEWPLLGDGWKRKEVVRRSGSSIGQKDVYYLSPRGDRVRSRVELVSVMAGALDLSQFEYKTGLFLNGQVPKRRRKKKKVRERSSSESSWLERGDGADTPDSIHRLTPNLVTKTSQQNLTCFLLPKHTETTVKPEPPNGDSIKLPLPSASRHTPLPAINGEAASQESILECSRCGISFTGTKYDKKRKKPCCASCWAFKTKEHPMIRFRKWIPCGQCMGCLTTVNCGQCANCRNGFQGTELRKRICSKRRCSCPIRKGLAVNPAVKKAEVEEVEDISNQFQPTPTECVTLKSSDTENVSLNPDPEDDEDMSTDDDDDWHKKRKRRACGECKACLCRRDCGTCDFCVDKPKFGGSNKKRQKCRLRQCQRQAMRHLLPAEMEIEFGADSSLLPGRPRPHYTYSRKSTAKKNKPHAEIDLTDNEDEDTGFLQNYWPLPPESNDLKSQSCMQMNHSEIMELNGVEELFSHANIRDSSYNCGGSVMTHCSDGYRFDSLMNQQDQPRKRNEGRTFKSKDGLNLVLNNMEEQDEREDEDDFPMITHIFSLADRSNGGGDQNQLAKLLKSLQEADLPVLWYAIMVDGPLLQIIQCSKKSSMADTMVLIDTAFHFQITVQKQPLLPTHWLYDDFPARLTCVAEVVNLLTALEKYSVCHGLPPKDTYSSLQPITLERASTCHFVVKKNVGVCSNCKLLCE
ncbi:methyl-CpG-binding domain protein 1b isoform X2 [Synchiropus splendidus]|uniref:methyl-CpG-binding domain protein 1b isoform X2 n=1 Tax=Synchiropus splendidus TaxID=270530 RepID=UPI00237D7177|nr:methyl-CpG-binding domain protein 1b isoform X2 [Synchiropus splendidus]